MKPTIWVEKYRPKTLSDVIFQDDRQKEQFVTYISEGTIPNLMLSGIQGTGKTSISKALINDLGIDKSDVLRINCSDKKIDALRSEVTSFAMTLPFGKFKVVQLEEFDYLSLESQALLRGLIEDTSGGCRYIATCNYENKIIPPLKSRFQHFSFKAPDKEQLALRLASMLDNENVEFEPETLISYIDVGYPDIRKTIQLLQANSRNGKLMGATSTTAVESDWKFELLSCIINGDFKRARKVVCESSSKEEHVEIFTFLYQNVEKMKVADKDAAIITIADYLAKHALVADTEINLAACILSLGRLE